MFSTISCFFDKFPSVPPFCFSGAARPMSDTSVFCRVKDLHTPEMRSWTFSMGCCVFRWTLARASGFSGRQKIAKTHFQLISGHGLLLREDLQSLRRLKYSFEIKRSMLLNADMRLIGFGRMTPKSDIK
jgi:hypothetical protein